MWTQVGPGRRPNREEGAGLFQHQSWIGGTLSDIGVNLAVVSEGPLVDGSRTLPSTGNQLCPGV